MWPLLTFAAVAGLVITHFWWRTRFLQRQREIDQCKAALSLLRQEQAQTVQQNKAEEQALFNSMLEGFLLIDKDGHVQAVNQALERLFGINRDVRGQTLMEAFRMHALLELSERVRREVQVRGFELELSGIQTRLVEVNAAAIIDQNQRQQGIIFIFHDLTRLKELENTRREFVANVSHELRTPLSLIKGYVETLLDGAKDDPAVATRFLETIQKHSDRLTFLIEDLLTISRLESGQVILNRQPIPLRESVEKVFDELQMKAAAKRISLENGLPPDLIVEADSQRLHQVLANLVENAIKYGKPEGRVRIAQGVRSDGTTAEISVRDDGPGIPAESLGRIFERFYRVDRARSREQGGTGLGLSIVKHIIQSHGGEVRAESNPGEGAALFFTLPLAASKEASTGAPKLSFSEC